MANKEQNNENEITKDTKSTQTEPVVEVVEEKKDKKEKKDLTISQRKVRHGILSTVAVVVVIAAVIILNVFLSSKNWSIDLTSSKLYTLSDATEKMLDTLKKDTKITVYFLNAKGNTNSVYTNILDQIENASKYVTVEYKDLELYPDFASKYITDGSNAAENDMIVVGNDRSRYVSSSDYVSYDYGEDGSASTTVNLESKLVSAIDYCMTGEATKVYTLTGQGETDLSDNFQSGLSNDNYDIESLDVVVSGGIPKDCKLLIINSPTSDLSDSLVENIEEYMDNGGKLFVTLNPNQTYEKLNALLLKYGVKVNEGIVVENGSGYYMGNYPTYLLPTLASHDITQPISSKSMHILAPVSKGLSAEKVDGYTVTDLLVTSNDSFSKVDVSSGSGEKTKDDIDGPFAIAQIVTNKDDEGVVFVSGSSSMDVSDIDSVVSGANSSFYCNAVNYMTAQESKIAVKSPTVTNTHAVFTSFASKMITAIGLIGIPVLLIVLGIVVIVVRKRS